MATNYIVIEMTNLTVVSTHPSRYDAVQAAIAYDGRAYVIKQFPKFQMIVYKNWQE